LWYGAGGHRCGAIVPDPLADTETGFLSDGLMLKMAYHDGL
jgi:hypothetical protein